MRIQVTLERPINWRDKQRDFTGYSAYQLFMIIKDILVVNGFVINHLDRQALILDTRIINRSKINIKVLGKPDKCVVKVNILNAYSPSVYDRFWEVVDSYLNT